MTENSLEKVIVALDFPQAGEAKAFLNLVSNKIKFVKIGMELFYAEGPRILDPIHSNGQKVFLDLKLHDIPATVTKAARVLAKHKVDMINVHAAGGFEMMKNSCEAYKEIHPEGKVIAVTQLTSTSQEVLNDQIGIPGPLNENVIHYAKLAKEAGLDGVVCSAWETELIKKNIGPDFLCVTPGIRLNLSQTQDQKRVKTPGQAVNAGSDFLVMGREITQSKNPIETLNLIAKDLQ